MYICISNPRPLAVVHIKSITEIVKIAMPRFRLRIKI